MALLHLLHEWAGSAGGLAVAFTFDHALRPGSGDESIAVSRWAQQLGVEHVVLRWEEPRPELGALQSRAREARYALLGAAAAERGILHLCTAHHAGDQAETFLFRLARGAGPNGLSGISARSCLPDLRLLRPLLGYSGDRLKATCRERGQEWLEDPSNASPRFARARLRAGRAVLESEGLTPESLCRTASQMGRARAALERATAAVLARTAQILPQGFAEIDADSWSGEDSELRRRSLSAVLHCIGGERFAPATDALDHVMNKLAGKAWPRCTVAMCIIEASGGTLRVVRELRNLPPSRRVGGAGWTRWDRFLVSAPDGFEVAALGAAGLPGSPLPMPPLVAATQPAFYRAGTLVAVPTLGYHAEASLAAAVRVRFSPVQAAGGMEFAVG